MARTQFHAYRLFAIDPNGKEIWCCADVTREGAEASYEAAKARGEFAGLTSPRVVKIKQKELGQ